MAFRDNQNYNHENAVEEFREGTFNVTQAVGKSEKGTGCAAANFLTDLQLIDYFLYMICRYGDRRIFPVSSESVFNNVKIQPRYQNYLLEETKKQVAQRIEYFQLNL